MKALIATAITALALIVMPAAANAATPAQQRASIQEMEAETLNRLYEARPDTRDEIANAVGYAVFDSGALAIIWVSGGYGHGVAHDNRTGKDTYMQMATAGIGLGLGVKDYNTVFVFHDSDSFEDFITVGLDLSGNADLAAKLGAKGDAVSGSAGVLRGMNIYQLTEDGLLAQIMLQGTKFWPDDRLNEGRVGAAEPTMIREERPAYNR